MRWLTLAALGVSCRPDGPELRRPPPTSPDVSPPISSSSVPDGAGATQVGSEGTECTASTIDYPPTVGNLYWPVYGDEDVPLDAEVLFDPDPPYDGLEIELSADGVALVGETSLWEGYGLLRFVAFAPLPAESEITLAVIDTIGLREPFLSTFHTGSALASEPGSVRLSSVSLSSESASLRTFDVQYELHHSAPREFATLRIQADDCSDPGAELISLTALPDATSPGHAYGFDTIGVGPDTDCFCAVVRSAGGVDGAVSDLVCLSP
jgi:hypothetical protein